MDKEEDILQDDYNSVIEDILNLFIENNIEYVISTDDSLMDKVCDEIRGITKEDIYKLSTETILDVALGLYPMIDKLRLLDYLYTRIYTTDVFIRFVYNNKVYKIRVKTFPILEISVDSGYGYVTPLSLSDSIRKLRFIIRDELDAMNPSEEIFSDIITRLTLLSPYYKFSFRLCSDVDGFEALYESIAKTIGTTDINTILDKSRSMRLSNSEMARFWDYMNSPYIVSNRVMLVVFGNKGHLTFKHNNNKIDYVYINNKSERYSFNNLMDYLQYVIDDNPSNGLYSAWKIRRCSEFMDLIRIIQKYNPNPSMTMKPINYGTYIVMNSLEKEDVEDFKNFLLLTKNYHLKLCKGVHYDETLYINERVRYLMGFDYFEYGFYVDNRFLLLSPRYVNCIRTNIMTNNCVSAHDVILRFFGMEEKTENDNTSTEHKRCKNTKYSKDREETDFTK